MWSCAEAQYTTCTQTEAENHYDVKATKTVLEYGKLSPVAWDFDITVSDRDIHISLTFRDTNQTREHVVKDGVYYTKYPNGVWEPPWSHLYGLGYVHSLINTRPFWQQDSFEHILCDRVGRNKAKIGHYIERMAMGTEYITGPNNEAGLSPEQIAELPDVNATWEYWIGRDGKIEKVKQTIVIAGGEGWEETYAEISGVGEPNVIVAPVMGSR